MKVLIVTTFLCLLGTQGGLSASQPDATAKVTFSDSFTPGPSPLWSNGLGNWTASGGQYFASIPNNNPTTYTLLPFQLTNFAVTVTVNGMGDGGIWLRANGAKGNPYLNSIGVILGGGGYGNGTRTFPAGTSVYFATPSGTNVNEVDGVFTPGDTYTIKVTAQGDTYSVYVNGSSTPVTTLVDSTFSHGEVGFYDDQPNTTTGSGFGPPTTFSNFTVTGSELAAAIASFSPTSGAAGTKVTIGGTDLQQATAVMFNGIAASFKQAYPSTRIVAIVPAGATTGPVTVVTPAGTATSKTNFMIP